MKKFATIYTATDERNAKFATVNNQPSLTQQSDAAEADINVIMERYGNTGQLPQKLEPGKYGDFSDVVDFRAAQDVIAQANQAFAEVPAKIRKQFDNDPVQFFDFVNNPDNLDELRKMGLAESAPQAPLETQQEVRYNDDGVIKTPSTEKENGKPSPAGDYRPPKQSAPSTSGRSGGR